NLKSMPSSLTSGDFNGDGLIDLALANKVNRTISLLINAGGKKFKDPIAIEVERLSAKIISADLNGDKIDDLVIFNQKSETITIYTNNGDGTFLLKNELQLLHTNTKMIFARDVNQDGAADLLAVNYDSNDIALLINEGDGAFRKPVYFPAGTHPSGAV